MRSEARKVKQARTRALGGQVVFYERGRDDRDAIASKLCERSGATFWHPYNDPGVIAGQGSVGAEAVGQALALDTGPDPR